MTNAAANISRPSNMNFINTPCSPNFNQRMMSFGDASCKDAAAAGREQPKLILTGHGRDRVEMPRADAVGDQAIAIALLVPRRRFHATSWADRVIR
jgi:hypothetical protein